MSSVRSYNLSLKYQRFHPSDCKDIGIRKFLFVAKTQFLYILQDSILFNYENCWLYRALTNQTHLVGFERFEISFKFLASTIVLILSLSLLFQLGRLAMSQWLLQLRYQQYQRFLISNPDLYPLVLHSWISSISGISGWILLS